MEGSKLFSLSTTVRVESIGYFCVIIEIACDEALYYIYQTTKSVDLTKHSLDVLLILMADLFFLPTSSTLHLAH